MSCFFVLFFFMTTLLRKTRFSNLVAAVLSVLKQTSSKLSVSCVCNFLNGKFHLKKKNVMLYSPEVIKFWTHTIIAGQDSPSEPTLTTE